jgi:uncharacterized coiled-coil DUF342 family protein
MTKLELKQKELIELLKRIFETDTLDLPKVDKLESEIAELEKQAEKPRKSKKDDAYGGLGSEMDTNSMNFNNLKL